MISDTWIVFFYRLLKMMSGGIFRFGEGTLNGEYKRNVFPTPIILFYDDIGKNALFCMY